MRFSVFVVVLFVVGCVGPFEDPSVRAARQAVGPDSGTPPYELDAATPLTVCDNNGDCSGGMNCIEHLCVPAVDAGLPDAGVATGIDAGAPTGGGTGSSTGGGIGTTGGGYVGGGTGTTGGGYVGGGTGTTGGGYVSGGGGSVIGGGTALGGGSGSVTGGGSGGGTVTGGGTGTSAGLSCSPSQSGTVITCVGDDGAHLGWSVSLCSQKVFVAGAPGVQGLLRYNNGAMVWKQVTDAPDTIGETSLCKTATLAYTGGHGGIYKLNEVDQFEKLWPYATTAIGELYEGPAEFTQLATAETSDGDTGLLRLTTGGFVVGWHDSSVFNLSLATSPDGTEPLVAVGSQGGNSDVVTVLQRAPNGDDFEFYTSTDALNAFPLAGVAVAIGNVWPDEAGSGLPPNEVLVASQNYLFIFRSDLSYVTKFHFASAIGSTAGLPVSIAVDDGLLTTSSRLHPFWLGLPGSNQVLRCLGTRCLPWQSGEAGSDYGAAIAVKNNTVLVGAPSEQNGRGAVHLYPRQLPDLSGEDQACDDQMPCCTSAGYSGTCVGGVLCQVDTSQTPVLCGRIDGGVPDGGAEDGGLLDAGTPDGGGADGGGDVTPDDPGPASFAARGCNAAPGALGVVLMLLALRHARRAS